MREQAIVLNQLTKHYGTHRGINDLSFSVNEGEFFGFIGPNAPSAASPVCPTEPARLAATTTVARSSKLPRTNPKESEPPASAACTAAVTGGSDYLRSCCASPASRGGYKES